METNFFSNPIVIISILILLLPLTLTILEQSLPLIQERVTVSFPVLRDWMFRAFHWGGQLVTDAGELSLTQAVAQSAGAVAMITFFVVFAVCELQFTWATLCPMFGETCTGEAFARYDRWLAYSTILLAVEFGIVASDLCGVTYTTHFARTQRARLFFLVVAVLCCLLSITIGVVMAWYRDLVLQMGQPNSVVVETAAAVQDLQTIILISLAALLALGALFAFLSYETVCSTVCAGLAVVSGVALALTYLLLTVLDLVVAVVLVIVKAIQASLAPLTEAFHRRMQRVKTGGNTMWTKLHGLVTPRQTTKAPTKAKQESSASSEPGQEVNAEAPSMEKQSKEQVVNGYDAHA